MGIQNLTKLKRTTNMEIVDDEYWLKYAKTSIESSITSRNQGAAKLETMVLWFWGLYTASFTIGVSINLIEASVPVLILLASPVVLLIFSYWFCVLAQLPVNAEFDANIPFEIKEAYNSGLKVKNTRFKIALASTFVSALLLGTALFSLSFVHKKDHYAITASFSDKKDVIIISGTLPKNTIVKTTIDSVANSKSKKTFYVNSFKVQENGILNINVPADSTMKDLLISTVWKEDNVEKGFVQVLKK
jgi:hypothetical protein